MSCKKNLNKSRIKLKQLNNNEKYSNSYRRLKTYNDILVRVGKFDLQSKKYNCSIINSIDAINLNVRNLKKDNNQFYGNTIIQMNKNELSNEAVYLPTQQDWYNFLMQKHLNAVSNEDTDNGNNNNVGPVAAAVVGRHSGIYANAVDLIQSITVVTSNYSEIKHAKKNNEKLWKAVELSHENQVFECLYDGNVNINSMQDLKGYFFWNASESGIGNNNNNNRSNSERYTKIKIGKKHDKKHSTTGNNEINVSTFCHACYTGNLDIIRHFLFEFDSLDLNCGKITPLLLAINEKRYDLVELLIEYNNAQLMAFKQLQSELKLSDWIISHRINQRLNNNISSLIRFNSTFYQTSLVTVLLSNNSLSVRYFKTIFKMMIENIFELGNYQKIQLKGKTAQDPSIIHNLCKHNAHEKLRYMLKGIFKHEMNYNPNSSLLDLDRKDAATGKCGLLFACERGYWQCVELLIYFGADFNASDENDWSVLEFVSKTGDIKLCRFILFCIVDNCGNFEKFQSFFKRHFFKSLEICNNQGNHDIINFLELIQDNMQSSMLDVIKLICKDKKVKQSEIDTKYWHFMHQQQICNLFLKVMQNNKRAMNGIVNSVLSLLNKRLPISDDMLVLCYVYLTKQMQIDTDKTIIDQYKTFVQLLKNSVKKGLSIDNPCKKRDHLWFRTYLLDSNLWLQPYNNDSNNNNKQKSSNDDDSGTNNLLYTVIERAANESLEIGQKLLEINLKNEYENHRKDWTKLTNYESKTNTQHVNNSDKYGLRQDGIVNGIKPQFSSNQLFVNQESGFNGREIYDLNSYLYALIITAHAVNHSFQTQVKTMFEILDFPCQFKSGVVKEAKRAQIKAVVEYSEKPWPKTAQIVDYIRCSVTFNTSKELLAGVEHFLRLVKNGNGGCIKHIVRIKNGFSKYKNENIVELINDGFNFKYCDIKLNVIIEHNKTCIIGEIQFLLKFFLQSKIMGYSFYEILRRKEYISDISQMIQTRSDSNLYKEELSFMVIKKDYTTLCHQMLINASKMFSIENKDATPFLYHLYKAQWNEGMNLFYSSLLHFDKKFATTYLQHPKLKGAVSQIMANNDAFRIGQENQLFKKGGDDKWIFNV